jgi:hypothetical protein
LESILDVKKQWVTRVCTIFVLNAKINFAGKSAELPETAFHIGKSEIRLSAKVASFAPLNLTYRVSSPELGLADLRAPTADLGDRKITTIERDTRRASGLQRCERSDPRPSAHKISSLKRASH